jgi:hypothetical protein
LWSKRKAVIAGVAAAGLHGALWVNADHPIGLIAASSRPQEGLIVRNEHLRDGEITKVAGLPVTTAARTAFDLGRHLPADDAVALIDMLMHAISFPVDDVRVLAREHKGARGIRRLRAVLPWLTPAPHRPGRPGCDYSSSAPAFRLRPRRYR